MREPRFTDAWCFGKEFEAKSKICRVCLANKPCQKKFYKALGATSPQANNLLASALGNQRALKHFPTGLARKESRAETESR
jgi:hypothetical protein